MPKVEEWMASKASTSNCTLENAGIRKEWYVKAEIRGIWQVIPVLMDYEGATSR